MEKRNKFCQADMQLEQFEQRLDSDGEQLPCVLLDLSMHMSECEQPVDYQLEQ